MVRQHPHWLSYTPIQTLPQDGEWVEAVELEPVLIPCRMEPAGAARTVQTEDGTVLSYTDILYLPKGAPMAAFGAVVTVYRDAEQTEVLGTRTVKRFFHGQLNTRIWV